MDAVVYITGWITLGLLAAVLLVAAVSPFINAWIERQEEKDRQLAATLRLITGEDR